jgi:hypothetical protein
MAEPDPHGGTRDGHDDQIASADWLLRDEPDVRPPQPVAKPAATTGPGEVFDLVEGPRADEAAPPGPVPASGAARRPEVPAARRRETAARRGEHPARPEPEVLVEEVWSRQGEWGPTLLILAAWLAFVALILYFASGLESFMPVLLALTVGGAVAVVLSYPILITLERPVRMTPEQAVRDFYGALSHHIPHYRRMWLLLSTAGRTTAHYGSFEGFKAYWVDTLRTLKGDQAGAWTPLVFEVVEYRGDKSAGQTRIDARFTLKISIRGRRQAGPIASIPALVSLVRGPDKMWYLDSGALPHATG